MTARRIVLTLAAALSLSMLPCAFAGEGHDHGDNPAAPNANGPQRLPDGSVFLPKPAQRSSACAPCAPRKARCHARSN